MALLEKKRPEGGSYIHYSRYRFLALISPLNRILPYAQHLLLRDVSMCDACSAEFGGIWWRGYHGPFFGDRRCDNANYFLHGRGSTWVETGVLQVVSVTHVLLPAVRR